MGSDEITKCKAKVTIRLEEKLIEQIRIMSKEDNCSSQNEFITKAIEFYCGYLSMNNSEEFLSKILTSTLKSLIAESDNKVNRMLFKLAVEQAMTMNIIAANNDMDDISLSRLRGSCVDEVKRLNGGFSFEDAVKWQKG